MNERFERFSFAAVAVPALAVSMFAMAVFSTVWTVRYLTQMPVPDYQQFLIKH